MMYRWSKIYSPRQRMAEPPKGDIQEMLHLSADEAKGETTR
jgi:hypothetical protein